MNSFSKKFDAELYYLRGINQRFLYGRALVCRQAQPLDRALLVRLKNGRIWEPGPVIQMKFLNP